MRHKLCVSLVARVALPLSHLILPQSAQTLLSSSHLQMLQLPIISTLVGFLKLMLCVNVFPAILGAFLFAQRPSYENPLRPCMLPASTVKSSFSKGLNVVPRIFLLFQKYNFSLWLHFAKEMKEPQKFSSWSGYPYAKCSRGDFVCRSHAFLRL